MFKIAIATYPLIFFLILISIQGTIEDITGIPNQEFMPYIYTIASFFLIIALFLFIKDKRYRVTKPDERTKKVDYLALSYSWLIAYVFLFIMGFIGDFLNYSASLVMSIVLIEMMVTMTVFHVNFNIRRKF